MTFFVDNGHADKLRVQNIAADHGDCEGADMLDLVAQTVIDKLEEQRHIDQFLDQVVGRVRAWRPDLAKTLDLSKADTNAAETGKGI